jgi:hypothetical protein
VAVANSPAGCVWQQVLPTIPGNTATIDWQMQITAPLPLEAIAAVFRLAAEEKSSPLMPFLKRQRGKFVYVAREYFQSSPNGITTESVQEDVLGFFSLVMSYAKSADDNRDSDKSIKSDFFIMPRSDFVTLYRQIKVNLRGSLYDIAKVLSCYKIFSDDDEYEVE